jgi:hypothetical protein
MRFLILACLLVLSFNYTKAQDTTSLYEMRTYYAAEGKLENLLSRFRNHTTKLFEKHGMKNIGYWLPVDNKENKLMYILAYPSKEARDLSWKNFKEDTEWIAVKKKSELNGPIISKTENSFLNETDFSQHNFSNVGDRIFELRTYKTTPYNLGLLLARFRNHTCDLFAKHGMTNLVYFTKEKTDDMLIYLLAHKSVEAAKASFGGFVKDQDWLDAKAASEKLAKGTLTVSVKSEYYVPTDFSDWK